MIWIGSNISWHCIDRYSRSGTSYPQVALCVAASFIFTDGLGALVRTLCILQRAGDWPGLVHVSDQHRPHGAPLRIPRGCRWEVLFTLTFYPNDLDLFLPKWLDLFLPKWLDLFLPKWLDLFFHLTWPVLPKWLELILPKWLDLILPKLLGLFLP